MNKKEKTEIDFELHELIDKQTQLVEFIEKHKHCASCGRTLTYFDFGFSRCNTCRQEIAKRNQIQECLQVEKELKMEKLKGDILTWCAFAVVFLLGVLFGGAFLWR